jgi:hypothetical protein
MLQCSAEDLMGLFQRRSTEDPNGRAAAADADTTVDLAVVGPPGAPAAIHLPAEPAAPISQLPVGLNGFPLLPLGQALWSDDIVNVVNLEAVVPHLPDSLLVLQGPTCQAAALISGGAIVDAIWVNGTGGLLGQDAARALIGSTEGTLTSHRVADPRLVTALPMLWRAPRIGAGLPSAWMNAFDVMAEVRDSRRSCGLVVDSADPGAALFESGELIAVYSAADRRPSTSTGTLRELLLSPGAVVTLISHPFEDTADTEAAGEVAEAEAVVAEPSTEETPADTVTVEETDVQATAAETDAEAAAVAAEAEVEATATETEVPAGATETDVQPVESDPDVEAAAEDTGVEETVAEDISVEPVAAKAPTGPALFTIEADEDVVEPTEMEWVEAREAQEFVPARLDIDVDALRSELAVIAVAWLGADAAEPVLQAIAATRPGVDDFVSTIAAIAAMSIPGHENAVVRAMAREMHYRATEVLTGV